MRRLTGSIRTVVEGCRPGALIMDQRPAQPEPPQTGAPGALPPAPDRLDPGAPAGRAARELPLTREQLATLVEIHRAIAGHLDHRALFMAVVSALQRVTPLDGVVLLLPDADPAALAVYAAHGRRGVAFFQGETLPRVGTMAGWVVAHGRPLVARRRRTCGRASPSATSAWCTRAWARSRSGRCSRTTDRSGRSP